MRSNKLGNCLRKRYYRSYRAADNTRLKIFRERNVALRVYGCDICSLYHLTKYKVESPPSQKLEDYTIIEVISHAKTLVEREGREFIYCKKRKHIKTIEEYEEVLNDDN